MAETSENQSEYAALLLNNLITKAASRSTAETALLRLLTVLISEYEGKLNLFPTDEVPPALLI